MGALFTATASPGDGCGNTPSSTRRRRRQREGVNHSPPPQLLLQGTCPDHQEVVGGGGGNGRDSPSSISSYDGCGAGGSASTTAPSLTPLSLSSSSSSLSMRRSYYPRMRQPKPALALSRASSLLWVRRAWTAHFVSSLLLLAILSVGGNRYERKYVPIGTSSVLLQCSRGFINVMATSPNDPEAVVCCEALVVVDPTADNNATVSSGELSSASMFARWVQVPSLHESSSTFLDLCPNRSGEYQVLPLASRLSRFPDAWLIPLSPLLLRFLCLAISYLHWTLREYVRRLGRFIMRVRGRHRMRKPHVQHRPPQPPDLYQQFVPMLLRLGLYVLIFNFRGWVLYVAFNQVEDSIVSVPHRNTCSWYLAFLREDQRHECVGRVFDFSDHMVLYYAQLLPIPLLETLYAFLNPYWGRRTSAGSNLNAGDRPSVAVPHHHDLPSPRLTADDSEYVYDSPVEQDPGVGKPVASQSSASWTIVERAIQWFGDRSIPLLLACGLAYLYLITYLGVYKTASFFHTIDEVVLGYVVSLAVQVPMAMLLLWNNFEGDDDSKDVRRNRRGSPRLPRNSTESKAPLDAPTSRPSSLGFTRILTRSRALLFPFTD